jgi:hypothetical protein
MKARVFLRKPDVPGFWPSIGAVLIVVIVISKFLYAAGLWAKKQAKAAQTKSVDPATRCASTSNLDVSKVNSHTLASTNGSNMMCISSLLISKSRQQ